MSEQSGSWQPDPFGRHQYRFWNGSEWTDQVANEGVVSVDPPVAQPAAGAPETPGAEPAPVQPAATEPTPAEPAPAEPAAPEPSPPEPAPPAAPSTPQGWAAPDATTAMPASPPAAGAPGGPGAPAEPVATGGGGGGGGNLPGIIVGVVLLALLLGAAAWFLFLRDDDDEARATVVASLRSEMGLSSAQADCVVDELDARLDLGRLADDIEADRDPSGAQIIAIMQAFEACRIDSPLFDDDSAAGTTTTTRDADGDDTSTPGMSIPPALLDLIAQGIMEESGLTQEQARCFAEEIFTLEGLDFTGIMADPDSFGEEMMTDPGMLISFFEIFERCGIDPLEFDSGTDGASGLLPGNTYGDNPVLDRLWDRCAAGDGEACDELYFSSQFGSEYEEYGDTCGGRFPAGTVFCANEDLS